MSENKKVIGERLKAAREKHGLKQYRVAQMLGVHNSTLAKYESGEREADNETIAKLADIYEVSIDYLLTGNSINVETRSSEAQYDLKLFAERLKKHRIFQELSIEELAEKIALTPNTVEKFEDGRGGIPGKKTLDKLASVLGITRDYLLGYTDDPKGYGAGVYETDSPDLKDVLESQGPLRYDGVPLTEEQKEKMALLMRQAYFIVKEENKKEAAKRRKKED